MSAPTKPAGWTVLGTGPLADAVRQTIAEDPDRYRPVTTSARPVGRCPCCDEDVYRVENRHTGWRPGFSSKPMAGKDEPAGIHPGFNAETKEPDPDGTLAGCCCVAPDWGPKHLEEKPRKRGKR